MESLTCDQKNPLTQSTDLNEEEGFVLTEWICKEKNISYVAKFYPGYLNKLLKLWA